MARLQEGICPCCGKTRKLAYFEFGIVKLTACLYCINHYIVKSAIPMFESSFASRSECPIMPKDEIETGEVIEIE